MLRISCLDLDCAVRKGFLEHGLLSAGDFISVEVQLGQFAKTCNRRDVGDLVVADPQRLQLGQALQCRHVGERIAIQLQRAQAIECWDVIHPGNAVVVDPQRHQLVQSHERRQVGHLVAPQREPPQLLQFRQGFQLDDLIVGEAIAAGRLAYEPITPTSYGVDVVSIRFDQAGTPSIVWRETQGMSPMSNVLTDVAALSAPDSGVLVVGVEYNYQPFFAGFMVSDIAMHEKAFARGRQSAVVCRQGMPC